MCEKVKKRRLAIVYILLVCYSGSYGINIPLYTEVVDTCTIQRGESSPRVDSAVLAESGNDDETIPEYQPALHLGKRGKVIAFLISGLILGAAGALVAFRYKAASSGTQRESIPPPPELPKI